jgi:hypothetical protein
MVGRRQWAETKTRLRAAGLNLAPSARFKPKQVPDDQNFCASPALVHALRASGSPRSPVSRLHRQLGLLTGDSPLSRISSPPIPTDWSRLWQATRSRTKRPRRSEADSLEAQISMDSLHPQEELASALEAKLTDVLKELEARLDLPHAEMGELTDTYALAEFIGLLEWRAHLALFVGDFDRGVRTWRILWRLGGARTLGRRRATDWLFTALRDRQLNGSHLREIATHALPGDLLAASRREILNTLASLDETIEEMEADRGLRGRFSSSCGWVGSPRTRQN